MLQLRLPLEGGRTMSGLPYGDNWRVAGSAKHSRAWHSINERPAPQFPPERPERKTPIAPRAQIRNCRVWESAPRLFAVIYARAGVDNVNEYRIKESETGEKYIEFPFDWLPAEWRYSSSSARNAD